MRNFIRISVVSLSILSLSGCISWVEDTDDLREFVAATQSQQAPSIPLYQSSNHIVVLCMKLLICVSHFYPCWNPLLGGFNERRR